VRLFLVGVMGCALATVAGAGAATRFGLLFGGVLVGAALFGVALVVYVRDPILALIGLWLFEVFNAPLSAMVGYYSATGEAVRQGDEVLVVMFVCLTIWRTLRSSVPLPPLRIVVPAVAVGLFGIVGAITHGVPLSVAALGGWLGLKLWIMILMTFLLPWKENDLTRVYRVFVWVGLIVAFIGLADYLTHGAVSRTLHTSNTSVHAGGYRSEAVHSILPGPGEYSLFMSLLFAIAFAKFTNGYGKSDLITAVVFAGSVMLSLRLKGFLSLAAVIAIVGIVQGASSSRRALIALVVGAILIAVAYRAEGNVIERQFSTYASSESSARSRLYKAGEQIATANFPFGVGFGRFASYPSRLNYSPVYYQYRLNRVYGLSPSYRNFIDDTSWPSVIGETGYGGFVAYCAGLVALILAMIRCIRRVPIRSRWIPLGALCTVAVIVVDSLGDATLFAWLATTMLAMVVGPTLVGIQSPPRTSADDRGRVDESKLASQHA
jgi:hypothetical protein